MYLITHKNQEISHQKNGVISKMLSYIMKEKGIEPELDTPSEDYELLQSLESAKNEWINANLNFEYADNDEMVDYHTYKIKACQVRYEYFLKKVKEKGLKVDAIGFNETGISSVGTNETL